MSTQHMLVHNLFAEESVVDTCIGLIERYAAKTARVHAGFASNREPVRYGPITAEQRARILQLSAQHWAHASIAAAVKCSTSSVSKIVRAAGIRLPHWRHRRIIK